MTTIPSVRQNKNYGGDFLYAETNIHRHIERTITGSDGSVQHDVKRICKREGGGIEMFPTIEKFRVEMMLERLTKLSKESKKQSEKIKELEARIEKLEENK